MRLQKHIGETGLPIHMKKLMFLKPEKNIPIKCV